jgi:hypothetical protein
MRGMRKPTTAGSNHTKALPAVLQAVLAYTTTDAGPVIAKSSSWLRLQRRIDTQRIAAGLEPHGPAWRVTETGTVLYLAADLQQWLLEHTVERGQLKFRGHLGNGEHAK